MAPWSQSNAMNTMTCSLKSINLLVSYPHKNKMKSPCFRQKPTFQLSNHWDSGDDALSFSSKFRVPKGQHFRPAGKRLVKVVDVNLFDPEETLKGSSKRGNKWCLRGGSIHCCMTIWHRVKKMLIPTPHSGVCLRRTQLVHTLVASLRVFWDVHQN